MCQSNLSNTGEWQASTTKRFKAIGPFGASNGGGSVACVAENISVVWVRIRLERKEQNNDQRGWGFTHFKKSQDKYDQSKSLEKLYLKAFYLDSRYTCHIYT